MLTSSDLSEALEMLSGFENISREEREQVLEGFALLMYQVVENFDNKNPFYKNHPVSEECSKKLHHYEELLDGKLSEVVFTAHALFQSNYRGVLPRSLLFETVKTKKGVESVWKASRPSSLLIRSPAELRADLNRVFEMVESVDGFALWIGTLPTTLAERANEPFIDVVYLYDTQDWSAIGVMTSSGVSWLQVNAETLDACLFTALTLNAGARFRGGHRMLLRELTTATVMALSQSTGLKPPLMDSTKALEAAKYLWEEAVAPRRAIDAYFIGMGQSTCSDLDTALFSLADLMERSSERASEAHKEGELKGLKQIKRLTKDLEKMTMGYNGLKARAARQEQELVKLKKQVEQTARHSSDTVTATPSSTLAPQKSLGMSVKNLLMAPSP